MAYRSVTYFQCPDPTDHLCHALTLLPVAGERSRSYWKLLKGLQRIPKVTAMIRSEAQTLLTQLSTAANVGVVWAGWKKRTQQFLKAYHTQLLAQRTHTMDPTSPTPQWWHTNRL
ncbi:hypothetical protein H310_05226 [Aphanomyces invadans]|uniref:Uncharacterized protein n=1 Tax=Aphanomyces invadans TaxID=157072 RepID=A0A024U922_9STRA|nr:hypothetical protein H310_05226 [Aphanomyces invadans]ETW02725.1 hypothetical protein H310_05226 [Aphanomyces invadans]|eukprot:XP_008868109.1 hypothetical protein H310_05226 [Aphanomyces invadans]